MSAGVDGSKANAVLSRTLPLHPVAVATSPPRVDAKERPWAQYLKHQFLNKETSIARARPAHKHRDTLEEAPLHDMSPQTSSYVLDKTARLSTAQLQQSVVSSKNYCLAASRENMAEATDQEHASQRLEGELGPVSTHHTRVYLTNRKEWSRGYRALAGRSSTAAAEAMATRLCCRVRLSLGPLEAGSITAAQPDFGFKATDRWSDGLATSRPGRERTSRSGACNVLYTAAAVWFLPSFFLPSVETVSSVHFQATHTVT